MSALLHTVLVHLREGRWTEAHNLVQTDESALGHWLHGIVHVQEGDLEDAEYWYDKAGQHFRGRGTWAQEIERFEVALEVQSSETIIREAAQGSEEGRLHFGQVIAAMVQAGVSSYAVDYRAQRTTYYLNHGTVLTVDLDTSDMTVAEAFDASAVKAAIQAAQQGVVKYPEFKRLTAQAGCVGYTVWIGGRHVSYHGRRGEMHVENFPG